MNAKFYLLLIGITIAVSMFHCKSATEEEKKEKSLVLFKELGSELKGELVQAVKTKGSENAIEVCAKISPEMEEKISGEHDLRLRRISDKNRNPEHAPLDWENQVIQKWKSDKENGIQPAVFTQKAEGEYRVMKPILIDNPTCLKCHGDPSEINQKTSEKIYEVYPNDKARGYKMGDIRGAFSASWKI